MTRATWGWPGRTGGYRHSSFSPGWTRWWVRVWRASCRVLMTCSTYHLVWRQPTRPCSSRGLWRSSDSSELCTSELSIKQISLLYRLSTARLPPEEWRCMRGVGGHFQETILLFLSPSFPLCYTSCTYLSTAYKETKRLTHSGCPTFLSWTSDSTSLCSLTLLSFTGSSHI